MPHADSQVPVQPRAIAFSRFDRLVGTQRIDDVRGQKQRAMKIFAAGTVQGQMFDAGQGLFHAPSDGVPFWKQNVVELHDQNVHQQTQPRIGPQRTNAVQRLVKQVVGVLKPILFVRRVRTFQQSIALYDVAHFISDSCQKHDGKKPVAIRGFAPVVFDHFTFQFVQQFSGNGTTLRSDTAVGTGVPYFKKNGRGVVPDVVQGSVLVFAKELLHKFHSFEHRLVAKFAQFFDVVFFAFEVAAKVGHFWGGGGRRQRGRGEGFERSVFEGTRGFAFVGFGFDWFGRGGAGGGWV